MKLSDVVYCQSILLQTFSLNFYAIFTNINNEITYYILGICNNIYSTIPYTGCPIN